MVDDCSTEESLDHEVDSLIHLCEDLHDAILYDEHDFCDFVVLEDHGATLKVLLFQREDDVSFRVIVELLKEVDTVDTLQQETGEGVVVLVDLHLKTLLHDVRILDEKFVQRLLSHLCHRAVVGG